MLDFSTAPTEASVVADLAQSAVETEVLYPENVNVRNGQVINLDHLLGEPRRTKGTTALFDDESFSRFVKQLSGEARQHYVRIYGDFLTFRFVAVLNDATDSSAGWADHRAVLDLRPTPEWSHWASHDGDLMEQEAFAEHIETGSDEVREPTAAELLEMAQTFHATTGVAFKSSTFLDNGQRQLVYEETIAAKAGQGGTIKIPKEFELGIAPFEGCDPFKVVARLRFRLRSSQLTIGYQLVRPDAVQRAAFNDVLQRIGAETGIEPLAGTPPVGV